MPLSSICRVLFWPAFLVATLLAGPGCERSDDKITVYRVPKEAPSPATMPSAGTDPAGPAAVHWTAPAGWEEQAASDFRKGSFLVRGAEGVTADVSIISFPKAAGGLMANVNRWRDQLKLPPINDVVQAGKPIPVAGRDMFFVDLVSEQPIDKVGGKARILGGIFPAGGETWFFKMTGPDALVESQRETFTQFLESVHLDGNSAAPMAAESAPMSANVGGNDTDAPTPPPIETAQGGPLQYTLPSGWQEKPLTPMRLASFKATAPNGKETDVSVVALPGVAGGDLENVNRWRGQVRLGPIDEKTLAQSAEHVQANGHDFLLVDLVSNQPIGAEGEMQRILAAILDENDRSWFIKMTGEDAAVAAQKSAFTDFLRGLKIP
ncbi:MAG: hypothetical protein ABIR38_08490 [Chthoniobacterales bacterium]